jgi:pilus assembly protein CpaE
MVCLGAKGGSGVTTIACNLAISIGQESAQSTLLIDLGLPMGDAALNLGIVTEFSTDNAFMDVTAWTRHSSPNSWPSIAQEYLY